MFSSIRRCLRTPSRAWVLAVYAILIIVSSPFVVVSAIRSLNPSVFDASGIPILGYLSMVLPLYVLFLLVGLQHYSGEQDILVWNKNRPVWSAVWTLLFLYLVCIAVTMFIGSVQGRQAFTSVFFMAQVHVLLLLRSSVVSKGMKEQEPVKVSEKDVEKDIESIQQLVRSKNLKGASEALDRMLKHDTMKCFASHVELREKLRDVLVEVAEAYIAAGAIDTATCNLLLIEEKLKVQDNGRIVYNLARCEFLRGHFDEGVRITKESINDVDDGIACLMYQLLGEQLLRAGKYERALETYEAAIRRFDGVDYSKDVKQDISEIVAALILCASEAALGMGNNQKSEQFLDALDARRDIPDWVQESARDMRAGKSGLRSDPLYWQKQNVVAPLNGVDPLIR